MSREQSSRHMWAMPLRCKQGLNHKKPSVNCGRLYSQKMITASPIPHALLKCDFPIFLPSNGGISGLSP